MGHWNHRVMQRVFAGEKTLAIFEVFYTDEGVPLRWDETPCAPFYNSETDSDWSLRQDHDRMAEAFDKPTLDHETGMPVTPES